MFEEGKQTQRDLVTRYESKYIVPQTLVPEIRRFIMPFCQPDPYAAGTPPEYTITTLQLDDPYYSLHRAKEHESLNRFKLRVRTYGRIGSAPVFTEVKTKFGATIHKYRASFPFDLWCEELVTGSRLPRCFRSLRQEIDFLQFKRLVLEMGARPVLLVRYIRESYVGTVDRYARVTFDRRLEYQMTDSWTDFGVHGTWRGMDSSSAQGFGLSFSGVVLEVKTLSHAPVWVMDLVERFQLRKCGNCKYSTALWRENTFRRQVAMNETDAEELAQA